MWSQLNTFYKYALQVDLQQAIIKLLLDTPVKINIIEKLLV